MVCNAVTATDSLTTEEAEQPGGEESRRPSNVKLQWSIIAQAVGRGEVECLNRHRTLCHSQMKRGAFTHEEVRLVFVHNHVQNRT